MQPDRRGGRVRGRRRAGVALLGCMMLAGGCATPPAGEPAAAAGRAGAAAEPRVAMRTPAGAEWEDDGAPLVFAVPALDGAYGPDRPAGEQMVIVDPRRPAHVRFSAQGGGAAGERLVVSVDGRPVLELAAGDLGGPRAAAFVAPLPTGGGARLARLRFELAAEGEAGTVRVRNVEVVVGEGAPQLTVGEIQ